MAPSVRHAIVSALALGGANAASLPLQLPIDVPSWLTFGQGDPASRPLVDSEKLQSLIFPKALQKRAEDFFQLAKESEDEYNHPTRVIGSQGTYPWLRELACLPVHSQKR